MPLETAPLAAPRNSLQRSSAVSTDATEIENSEKATEEPVPERDSKLDNIPHTGGSRQPPAPSKASRFGSKELDDLCPNLPFMKSFLMGRCIKELQKRIKTPDAFAVFIKALVVENGSPKDAARPFFRANQPRKTKQVGLTELEKQFEAAVGAFKSLCKQMRECGMGDAKQEEILHAVFPGSVEKITADIAKKNTEKNAAQTADGPPIQAASVDREKILNAIEPKFPVEWETLNSLWKYVKQDPVEGQKPLKKAIDLFNPNKQRETNIIKEDLASTIGGTTFEVAGGMQLVAMPKPTKDSMTAFQEFMLGSNGGLIVDLTSSFESRAEGAVRYCPRDKHRNEIQYIEWALDIGVTCIERSERHADFNQSVENLTQEHKLLENEVWGIDDGKYVEQELVFEKQNEVKNKRTRLHFKDWPDHDAINVAGLITLANCVEKRAEDYPNKPILVHCTDGIGRTGALITFMAARKAIQAKMANDKANEPPCCTPKMVIDAALDFIKQAQEKRDPHFIQNKGQLDVVLNALMAHFKDPMAAYAAKPGATPPVDCNAASPDKSGAAAPAQDAKGSSAKVATAASPAKSAPAPPAASPNVPPKIDILEGSSNIKVTIHNGDKPIQRTLQANAIAFPEVKSVACTARAGKAPEDLACAEGYLMEAIESGRGLFQFVSAKAHRDSSGEEKKPIMDLLQARHKNDKNGLLGGRYQIESLTVDPSDPAGDSRRMTVVVLDIKNNDQKKTICLTQAGYPFDGIKLSAEQIADADRLMKEHIKHGKGVDEQAAISDEPMVISTGGFGRNSALITYREALKRLRGPDAVDEAEIRRVVAEIKKTGIEVHSPHFLFQSDQVDVLVKALRAELSRRQTEDSAKEASANGTGNAGSVPPSQTQGAAPAPAAAQAAPRERLHDKLAGYFPDIQKYHAARGGNDTSHNEELKAAARAAAQKVAELLRAYQSEKDWQVAQAGVDSLRAEIARVLAIIEPFLQHQEPEDRPDGGENFGQQSDSGPKPPVQQQEVLHDLDVDPDSLLETLQGFKDDLSSTSSSQPQSQTQPEPEPQPANG